MSWRALIVKDKSKLDIQDTTTLLNKWKNFKYGYIDGKICFHDKNQVSQLKNIFIINLIKKTEKGLQIIGYVHRWTTCIFLIVMDIVILDLVIYVRFQPE